MISRVLVPMDGSEMSQHALEFAISTHPDAEIVVLFVAGEPSPMMGKALSVVLEEDITNAAEDLAADVFDRAHAIADKHGVTVETAVDVGRPARAIVDRAESYDVVVMGSHGGDIASRLFVGNVTDQVVRRSPVPVTVVR